MIVTLHVASCGQPDALAFRDLVLFDNPVLSLLVDVVIGTSSAWVFQQELKTKRASNKGDTSENAGESEPPLFEDSQSGRLLKQRSSRPVPLLPPRLEPRAHDDHRRPAPHPPAT